MIPPFIAQLADKHRKLFLSVVAFVFVVIFYILFSSFNSSIKNVRKEIEKQKEIVATDMAVIKNKPRIAAQVQSYKKYFTEKLKDDDEVNNEFFRILERLASQTKVSLIKSNPGDIKKSERSMQYSAKVDCSGELSDIVSFMHAINSTNELLKVVSFNLTPKRGTVSEVNASMTISKLIVTPSLVLNDKATK